MDNNTEMTRDVVVSSLKHCASGSRCTECPSGGAPACKDIYTNAARIIEREEELKYKMASEISFLKDKVFSIEKSKSESIHKMWEAMMKVQQVYSDRCKTLESEIERLKAR